MDVHASLLLLWLLSGDRCSQALGFSFSHYCKATILGLGACKFPHNWLVIYNTKLVYLEVSYYLTYIYHSSPPPLTNHLYVITRGIGYTVVGNSASKPLKSIQCHVENCIKALYFSIYAYLHKYFSNKNLSFIFQ